MTTTDRYVPIDCEFHDVLESLATRARIVRVQYVDADGRLLQAEGRISDVRALGGEEHLSIATQTIRLDRLVCVDGVRRPGCDRVGQDAVAFTWTGMAGRS